MTYLRKSPFAGLDIEYDWTRWWQRKSPFASDQLHFQAVATALDCFDMAVRAVGDSNRRQDQGTCASGMISHEVYYVFRTRADGLSPQGFDEFMNLVIDDAVEVKQATKTEEEKRRSLG